VRILLRISVWTGESALRLALMGVRLTVWKQGGHFLAVLQVYSFPAVYRERDLEGVVPCGGCNAQGCEGGTCGWETLRLRG
jgi:hypothetical protein